MHLLLQQLLIKLARKVFVAKPVVVIGAGLAGMSATLTLQEAGRDVVLLESSDRAGGRIATDVIDGFLCDRGFQLINARYPEIINLEIIHEIDFIEAPRVVEVSVGDKRIALGDPRVAPFSSLNSKTGSLIEKISLLRYLAKKPQSGQSLGVQLRASGLGATYERVLKPFLTGVFFADPDRVDASYGRSVIGSFISGKPGLPRNGAGQLPRALAARITDLRLNTQVNAIKGRTVVTSLGPIEADEIIVATDLTTAAQLLDLRDIPEMVGCTTWYHSTPDSPSKSARLVIDGQARGPVLNTLVISNLSSTYAPVGQNLIATTSTLGATESEVRRHLSLLWGADTRAWNLVAKYDIPTALPLQGVNKKLAQGPQISDGVYIAGDHTSVPSQNGALLSGRLAAEALLATNA